MSLNSILQVASHFCSASRPTWSCLQWSSLVIVKYRMKSSADRPTFDLMFCGRSLRHVRKRTGPMTEPWGTPERTATKSDLSPSTTTHCWPFSRKALTQFTASPLITLFSSLQRSLLWGNVSKALDRSIMMKSVCLVRALSTISLTNSINCYSLIWIYENHAANDRGDCDVLGVTWYS